MRYKQIIEFFNHLIICSNLYLVCIVKYLLKLINPLDKFQLHQWISLYNCAQIIIFLALKILIFKIKNMNNLLQIISKIIYSNHYT
jgi:hypothetical protein